MLRDFSAVSGPSNRYLSRRVAAGLVAAAALGTPAVALLGAADASASLAAGRGGAFLEVAPVRALVPPPSPERGGAVALRCAIAAQASGDVAFVPPPVSCL